MRWIVPLIMVSAVLIAGTTRSTRSVSVSHTRDHGALRPDPGPGFFGYVSDQIIIRFDAAAVERFDPAELSRGRTGDPDIDGLGSKYGAVRLTAQFPGSVPRILDGRWFDLTGFFRVTFAAPVDIQFVVEEYAKLPEVISAEPIGIHSMTVTPNDESFPDEWHLEQANDHDIDARSAWMIETGSEDITVAILDTGIRYFHKDLGGSAASYQNPSAADGNMWINHVEKDGLAGVDDDGNGYVDDWIGWDFVDGADFCWPGEDCNDPDNDPRDFNGHGTHCAGSVGAINNNGYATSSTAGGWGDGTLGPAGNGVKVMTCRVGWSAKWFGDEIGFTQMDLVAEALVYAADNGARIASCSFKARFNTGGLATAIDYFVASGGLIFKAANNDGTEEADYMCGRSDVICVAATGPDDCVASFSNYGTWVDISAPGVGIYSLYHDHEDPQTDCVASFDGTSTAAPLAAGVAALIWSSHPGWTGDQVEQRLYDSADDIYALGCNAHYANKLGAGRINAFNAVNIDGAATGIRGGGARPARGFYVELDQNHPNPFNPATTIRFEIGGPAFVRLDIFDVAGRHVAALISENMSAGEHSYEWNPDGVASGVFFCRLSAGGRTITKRMVLMK